MTKIWRETGFVDNDPWVIESEEVTAGEGQKPVLPLADFLVKVAESNEGGLGVLIRPADDVTALHPYLDRIGLVAVAFPAFNDGRAFSHAALLRERLGYEGEIRAVGDVLIDPLALMLRTGITSFAVSNPTAIARLAEGRIPGIDLHYQPAQLSEKVPDTGARAYSWRRVAG